MVTIMVTRMVTRMAANNGREWLHIMGVIYGGMDEGRHQPSRCPWARRSAATEGTHRYHEWSQIKIKW
jgi:hypothetical protein